MNDIFAKLGIQAKTYIGVSVSPNVGVEMIQVDRMTGKIVKYSNRPLNYNVSNREIVDYNEFQNAVIGLFGELHISERGANVVVNMPSAHFGFMSLPASLSDDAIDQAVISEVEQSYLFKRKTPVVSWTELSSNNQTNKKTLVYTALQEEAVNSIKEIFDELGSKLVAIENSYASLFKTLEYSGIAYEQIQNNDSWNLLLVTSNSYTVFNLLGNKINEYYEDPLAVKSFTNEEVYLAIASAATSTLNNYPAQKLLVISETNDVSAELLAMQIKFPGQKDFLERNVYAKDTTFVAVDSYILPNYVPAITLEAVGAGIYMYSDFNIKFNLLQGADGQDVSAAEVLYIFGQPIEVSRNLLVIIAVGLFFGIVILYFIINVVLGQFTTKIDNDITTINAEISKKETQVELAKHKTGFVDIYTAVANINKQNRKELQYFDSLSVDIPQKLWITYFYTDASDAIAIKGKAISVDDIYTYFRNVKSVVGESDLTLTKLTIGDSLGSVTDPTQSSPNDIYDFELTNAKFNDSLIKLGVPQKPVDPNAPQQPAPQNGQPMPTPITPPGVPVQQPGDPGIAPLQQIN